MAFHCCFVADFSFNILGKIVFTMILRKEYVLTINILGWNEKQHSYKISMYFDIQLNYMTLQTYWIKLAQNIKTNMGFLVLCSHSLKSSSLNSKMFLILGSIWIENNEINRNMDFYCHNLIQNAKFYLRTKFYWILRCFNFSNICL